jgi:hypothetical protein
MSYDIPFVADTTRKYTFRELKRERSELARRKMAHAERTKKLPPLKAGEAERLIQEHIQSKGVTRCPPMYAEPSYVQMLGRR